VLAGVAVVSVAFLQVQVRTLSPWHTPWQRELAGSVHEPCQHDAPCPPVGEALQRWRGADGYLRPGCRIVSGQMDTYLCTGGEDPKIPVWVLPDAVSRLDQGTPAWAWRVWTMADTSATPDQGGPRPRISTPTPPCGLAASLLLRPPWLEERLAPDI